jgi:hypothetical protein
LIAASRFARRYRLHQHRIGARGQRCGFMLFARFAADDEDLRRAQDLRLPARPLTKRQAIHARHVLVGEDQSGRPRSQQPCQRIGAACGGIASSADAGFGEARASIAFASLRGRPRSARRDQPAPCARLKLALAPKQNGRSFRSGRQAQSLMN